MLTLAATLLPDGQVDAPAIDDDGVPMAAGGGLRGGGPFPGWGAILQHAVRCPVGGDKGHAQGAGRCSGQSIHLRFALLRLLGGLLAPPSQDDGTDPDDFRRVGRLAGGGRREVHSSKHGGRYSAQWDDLHLGLGRYVDLQVFYQIHAGASLRTQEPGVMTPEGGASSQQQGATPSLEGIWVLFSNSDLFVVNIYLFPL